MRSLFSKSAVFLFHLLFLSVPLVFTSVNDELFEFNKMLVVYGFTLLILACWAGESILKQKFLFKRTPLDIPILIFLISQITSTVFSINVHTSLFGYYSRFNGGLFSVLAYIALYYLFVIFIDSKKIKNLVSSLLLGGVLAALYAFPEHFGHSPSCLIFTGNFDVTCWVQDVKTRVFGTFGQPNWLAAYLGMLLPLVIVSIKRVENETKLLKDDASSNWIQYPIRIGIAALFVSVLFFTGSRSGIIAVATGLSVLVAALGFSILKTRHNKTDNETRKNLTQYGLTLGVTGLLVVIMTLIIPNPIQEKLLSLVKTSPTITTQLQPQVQTGTQLEVGGSESGQIRNIVWKGAIKVWQRYPLFGSGVETFAYSYYKDRPVEHNLLSEWDFLYNKAHNELLNYLATTGIFGLGSYLVLLFFFVVFPIKTAVSLFSLKEKKWRNQIGLVLHDVFLLFSISAGIIIVSISNFFGFSTVMVSLLLFIFPAISVVVSSKYGEEDKTIALGENSEISSSQWAVAACCAAVFLLPIMYLHRLWSADVSYAKGKQLNSYSQVQAAFPKLREATTMVPEEPNFHDEYSYNLAALAVAFAQNGDATKTAEFASMAIEESNTTVKLNPVHTNYWKTRVKVFLTLAQLDVNFYSKAKEALLTAKDLSPTDPKIVLYLALLAQSQKNTDEYLSLLKEAIELKPNFEEARNQLAKFYEENKNYPLAIEQYEYMIKFINPNNQAAKDKIASLSAIKK